MTPHRRRPAFLAAAAAAALALGSAWGPVPGTVARADDASPEARAALRREVVDPLRKSDPAVRRGGLVTLAGCRDATPASLVGIEAAIVSEEVLRKSVAARDAQGKSLFAYHRAHFNRSLPSDTEMNTYDAMEAANHRLCQEVAENAHILDALRQVTRRNAALLAADAPDAAAWADSVRALLKTARTSSARAAVLASLDGPRRALLADDLIAVAVNPKAEREERVAALDVLAGAVDAAHAEALRPAVEVQDSYVRRAAFAALAEPPTKAAVGILVERMAREIGVPLDELTALLTKATGETFGPSAKAWADWWAASREVWEPAMRKEAPPPGATQGTTRFFGLDVASARVLFVLDRSWSMEFGTLYDGKDDMTAFAGEDKITIARRELKQAIRNLPDGASFNVIGYGTTMKPFAKKLVPATAEQRNKGCDWVERLELDGSTNLGGALLDAFESLEGGPDAKDAEIADTIVVLTDGVPNCGPIGKPEDVLAEIARLNRRRAVTIHAVYLGSEGNVSFMQGLAKQNGGKFVHYVK